MTARQSDAFHNHARRRLKQLADALGLVLQSYDLRSNAGGIAIAAGLPVIDSRVVAFKGIVRLAVRGPMAAVGEQASPALSWTLFRAGRCGGASLSGGRRRGL